MKRFFLPFFLMLSAGPVCAAGYNVTIASLDDELHALLAAHLEVMKWRDYEDMTPEQLERLYQGMADDARELLATAGYFSPQIDSRLIPADRADGKPTIRLDVRPGEPVTVQSVDIQLKGAIADDADHARRQRRAERAWTLKAGSRFTQAGWDDSKKAVLRSLLADRYPTARLADSAASIEPDAHAAALMAHYDSGPEFRLGQLTVKGLKRYPAGIVENLSGFNPGDPYQQQTLLDFQTRLQNTPYFSSVYVSADTDPARADAAPVTVEVVEGPQQKASAGVGYSTNTGERVELGYRHTNVLGRGWIADANTRIETRQQTAKLQLTLPSDRDDYVWSGYTGWEHKDIQGLDTNLYKHGISRARQHGLIETSIGLQYVGEKSRAGEAPQDYREALMLNWSWVKRDFNNPINPINPINPTRGHAWRIELGGAAQGILSSTSFTRAYGKGLVYLPLARGWGRFVLRGELGEVFARDGDEVPNDSLFRTGGANSVRGYSYESLGVDQNGAVVGGRVLAVGSAEYQYPVVRNWAAALFVDAGRAARNWQAFTPARGYGVGARWASPVGPLALDLAYGEEDRKVRLHFSLDLAF